MISSNGKTKKIFILIYIFIVIIVLSTLLSILKLIDEHNDDHESFLFKTSKTHFEDIVNSRAWNAQYGGVYVYKKEGIEPNPYLKNNHIYDKDGELLVKINPAWMTRMLSEVGKSDDYRFRITSLKPINPKNKADEFETRALEYLEEHSQESYYSEVKQNSDEYRFLGKLGVTDACMRCHAEQGYKVGDIRGGISVTLNAKDSYEILGFMDNVKLLVVFVAFMILLVSGYMIIFIYRHQLFVKNLNIRLEEDVKERTKELEAAKTEAENANRLKSEFLSNVTHEIKTPLNTILSMSKLAISECDSPEMDCLVSINNAGNNLNILVENIIDYSKLEAGLLELKTNTFNIKGLMSDIKNFINEKAVIKEVDVKLYVDSEIPALLNGDIQRVHQILNQLTDNAIKFTPSGGKITLSVKLLSKDSQRAHLLFSVRDSGIGITDEDQMKLFVDVLQLDQKLHRKYAGIGIGLVFCKKLIEVLGGSVSLKSKVDEGTTVDVELSFDISEIQKIESIEDELPIEHSKVVSDVNPSKECIELLHKLKTELDSDYSMAMDTLSKVKVMARNTKIEDEVSFISQKINLFDVDSAMILIDNLLEKITREGVE